MQVYASEPTGEIDSTKGLYLFNKLFHKGTTFSVGDGVLLNPPPAPKANQDKKSEDADNLEWRKQQVEEKLI